MSTKNCLPSPWIRGPSDEAPIWCRHALLIPAALSKYLHSSLLGRRISSHDHSLHECQRRPPPVPQVLADYNEIFSNTYQHVRRSRAVYPRIFCVSWAAGDDMHDRRYGILRLSKFPIYPDDILSSHTGNNNFFPYVRRRRAYFVQFHIACSTVQGFCAPSFSMLFQHKILLLSGVDRVPWSHGRVEAQQAVNTWVVLHCWE